MEVKSEPHPAVASARTTKTGSEAGAMIFMTDAHTLGGTIPVGADATVKTAQRVQQARGGVLPRGLLAPATGKGL